MDQHYHTAYHLLSSVWGANPYHYDDDLPVLLGSMAPWNDGKPADPACVEDWETAARASADGMGAMVMFLEAYRNRGEGDQLDVSRLLMEWRSAPHTLRALWHMAEKQSAQQLEAALSD
jgi:hypothetical protein